MNRIPDDQDRISLVRLVSCAFVFILFAVILPISVYANTEADTVRVGYYENEVFQEGAREGAVKTGYAYEYYRKMSEYTGWEYEYVYGGFGESLITLSSTMRMWILRPTRLL